MGVRINDAFISVFEDKDGVAGTVVNWKEAVESRQISTDNDIYSRRISEKEAILAARNSDHYDGEIVMVNLVYEPTENEGVNKLTYEIITSLSDRFYVDVQTGKVTTPCGDIHE